MSLYDNAVVIAKEYIGPAGQQFLDRQLVTHLKLDPAELNSTNLADLSKWCFTSGRLIIDSDLAKEFQDKILALAK
jgi:hypothetical protein